MHETRTLAEWVASLRLEDVPPEVVDHAHRFILDNFGCQLAGATLPWSRQYYDVIRRTKAGKHATVAYYGDRLSPDDAAFLNAVFNHANETDDTHLKSPTHPGQIAVPAALAMAEYADASGRDFLLAVIASYEVQIRVSWAASPHLQYSGHHPPPGVGPFGAAVASARVLGFDLDKTLNAMGMAGSHSAGLLEYTVNNRTGGSLKRMHAGIPAMGGVRAALFAEAGITGPDTILEGKKGFLEVFAKKYDLSRLTDGLGTRYHMLDNGLKPYSCCHLIHGAIDALDKARDATPFGPDDLEAITVVTNSEPNLTHVGTIIEPTDVLGAQFSTSFSLAMRLHHGGRGVHGGNGFWDYLQVDLKDPALLATARKIRTVLADTGDWASLDKSWGIEVKLRDGRTLRETVPYSKGLPENPLSPREVEEKFRYVVGPVVSAETIDAIVETVARIEDVPHIDEVVRLLVVPPEQRERATA